MTKKKEKDQSKNTNYAIGIIIVIIIIAIIIALSYYFMRPSIKVSSPVSSNGHAPPNIYDQLSL